MTMRCRHKALRDQRGSATIWVLAMAATLFAASIVVALSGSAATARNRAGTAADMAALAAAARLSSADNQVACRAAATVARRNGASLISCLTENGVADVRARVRLRGSLSKWGSATARARAAAGIGPYPVEATVRGDVGGGAMNAEGLTPRAERVRDLVRREFGERQLGGYCPGGCRSGHIPGSDHYSGRAVDIMLTPWRSEARVAKGWRIASWLVGNAEPLGVKYVIYRDRIWTPGDGWQDYQHPSGDTTNPTLRHLDHIHVSVY
ncbi:MAG: hypothetical protein GEV07_26685 [Streptosporangiales bacterium]|nr:hypothetical protein [Streptosporangiales bacterium]